MKEFRAEDKIDEATLLMPIKDDIPVRKDTFLLEPSNDGGKGGAPVGGEIRSAGDRKSQVRDG